MMPVSIRAIGAALAAALFFCAAAMPAHAQFTDQRTWGGTATGSANAVAVAIPNYGSHAPGVTLRFKAGAANTGATTVNVSGLGAVALQKVTTAGVIDLVGGEIQPNQIVAMVYDGTVYQIVNPSPLPQVEVGSIMYSAKQSPGPGWLPAFGQAISRASFPAYVAAVAPTQSAVKNTGNGTIAGVLNVEGFGAGMPIEGAGIQAGTTIVSCNIVAATCLLSNAPTVTQTSNVQVFTTGYGVGGDTTTVGVDDCRGVVLAGRGNMGGTPVNRLTPTYFGGDGNSLLAIGGLESNTIAQLNLPNITLNTAIAAGQGLHGHNVVNGSGGPDFPTFTGGSNGVNTGGGLNVNGTAFAVNNTLPAMSGTTALGGSGTPAANVQPTKIKNCYVRVSP